MKVRKICSLGYFDKVIVDGYMQTMYNNRGLEVQELESLASALENNKTGYNQGMGKLRINIMGEASNIETQEEIDNMRYYREEILKLTRTKLGSSDRYNIGYMDILILKSDYAFPSTVSNKGTTVDDMNKLAKGEDELELFTEALKLQEKMSNGKDKQTISIAIIDKVYINNKFRNCGLSTWLHSNMRDIIKVYCMIDIGAILLIPGDFSGEAETFFGMSKKQYLNFLVKHYKSVGYKFINKHVMYKEVKKDTK